MKNGKDLHFTNLIKCKQVKGNGKGFLVHVTAKKNKFYQTVIILGLHFAGRVEQR